MSTKTDQTNPTIPKDRQKTCREPVWVNSYPSKVKMLVDFPGALAAIDAGWVGTFVEIKILLGSYSKFFFFALRSELVESLTGFEFDSAGTGNPDSPFEPLTF